MQMCECSYWYFPFLWGKKKKVLSFSTQCEFLRITLFPTFVFLLRSFIDFGSTDNAMNCCAMREGCLCWFFLATSNDLLLLLSLEWENIELLRVNHCDITGGRTESTYCFLYMRAYCGLLRGRKWRVCLSFYCIYLMLLCECVFDCANACSFEFMIINFQSSINSTHVCARRKRVIMNLILIFYAPFFLR